MSISNPPIASYKYVFNFEFAYLGILIPNQTFC